MLLTPEQIIELTGYRLPRKQIQALRYMGVRHAFIEAAQQEDNYHSKDWKDQMIQDQGIDDVD